MQVFEFLAVAILILSVAGVVVVDRLFGAARRAGQHQVLVAEQRIQELLLRIEDLDRHNSELREQLEWHRRLLEAQDRVLKELPEERRTRV
jgi:type II secretory pathway pseudopilin PulG